MKFCLFSVLTFVSLVTALPRYPSPSTRLGAAPSLPSKPGSVGTSYAELVTIASSAFSGVVVFFGSPQLSFSSLWNAVRGRGLVPSQLATGSLWLPDPSHSDGHGTCPGNQFWFGPKQICVGGTNDVVEAPAGYYCPSDWKFSGALGCCIPQFPDAITRNDCSNGNGSWDLVRITCVRHSVPKSLKRSFVPATNA